MSLTSGRVIRNCAAALLLVLTAPFPAALRAASPMQSWVQRYPNAEGAKIAVDPEGNVVVAGCVGSYGPGLVIKYSSSGVGLWTNNVGHVLRALALDSSGNVYVAGSDFAGPRGGKGDCALTAAYSSSGVPLWTNWCWSYTEGDSVTVDVRGNVYTAGGWKAYNGDRFVVLAYSSGGTPLWTNLCNEGRSALVGTGFPVTVAVGGQGRVYVAGTVGIGEGGSCGNVVVAYSDVGIPLWTNHCWGAPSCSGAAQALTADAVGNVYVTSSTYNLTAALTSTGVRSWFNNYYGYQWGFSAALAVGLSSNIDVSVTGYSWGGSSGYDYATLSYSSAGIPLWTNVYDGPGHTNDYAQALAVGSDSTVYVTGYSWGTDSFYDYLTIAYSSDGVPLWTNRYNGPANGYDQAYAMAVDAGGNIYVTGYSQGDCTTIKLVPAPSIRFSAIDLVSGPACRLTIAAPTNLVFRLEASTNLSDWLTLTNYSNLPFSSIQYTDPLVPDFPRRYYRTAWAP
jgi:hypothetical protein